MTDSKKDNWLVCATTARRLERLDAALLRAVQPEDLYLRIVARYVLGQGGKRLRPALLLLAASYGDVDENRLLQAAAALELLHVASLYHDDVMDRAPLRRSVTSANARWGDGLATLAGTYLFARASALLASLGDLPNRLASEASVKLCAGQLNEVENAYNLELTEDEHLEILARKTATLFELPCRLGAALSAAPSEVAEALATYGRNLGLAFQLADDALDLAGDVDQMGKDVGTDLREGVYSLPVLRALRQGGEIAEKLSALLGQVRLTEHDVAAVLLAVRESGTLSEVRELAQTYAGRAQVALSALPRGPGRRSFSRLADYAISRAS